MPRLVARKLVAPKLMPPAPGAFALSGVIASLLVNFGPASAQTAAQTTYRSSTGIEVITVTALKRSTTLQKAPAAITAITASTLDKANITNVAGLNGLVPGTTFTKSSGFESIITIRGVGDETPENSFTTQPGVALIIDGVYISNTISLDQSLFDLDRIEVLRGPQGTLYGQSATGGVITVVTKQPVLNQLSGHVDASFGNYHLFQERAEVNVPVTSQIAVRASVQRLDHSGFATDETLHGFQLDDAHDESGKLAVLYQPSPEFSATLTGEWYLANQHGAEQKNILDPNPNPREVDQDYPGYFKLNTALYHLNLDYTLPFATLNSVSAFQDLGNYQTEDSSRLTFAQLGFYDDDAAWNTNLQTYSQEFNLQSLPGSKLEWTGGLFLLKQRTTQFVVEYEGSSPGANVSIPPTVESDPPGNLSYGNNSVVTRVSWAPYVQGTYHFNDALSLTAGVRYNHDFYHDYSRNFSAFGSSAADPSYTTGRTTGKVELDYDFTPVNMVYGEVTEAYKPGGVNGNSSSVVVRQTFVPEGITSFEAGSKNSFFDNSLRLNAAAFFYDYRNSQYIEVDPFPYAYGIANIPNTHIYGTEFEGSYLTLNDKLRFNGELTLEDGKMIGDYKAIDQTVATQVINTNPNCAYGGAYYNPACWAAIEDSAKNVSGNKPPKMPPVMAELSAQYTADLPTGELESKVEYVYRGHYYARIFNYDPLDYVPSYSIWNLNFNYQPNAANWTLNLAVTNLGNTAGINSRYTDPYGTAQTSDQYIPPRQIVGTVGYSF